LHPDFEEQMRRAQELELRRLEEEQRQEEEELRRLEEEHRQMQEAAAWRMRRENTNLIITNIARHLFANPVYPSDSDSLGDYDEAF
jgi:hypothetical protein